MGQKSHTWAPLKKTHEGVHALLQLADVQLCNDDINITLVLGYLLHAPHGLS